MMWGSLKTAMNPMRYLTFLAALLPMATVGPADAQDWIPTSITDELENPSVVRSADVDGDGDLDLVVSEFTEEEVLWFENTEGDASQWTRHLLMETFAFAEQLRVGDLDGDGDGDVVAVIESADRIEWYENAFGDGSFWVPHPLADMPSPSDIDLADVDGDGDLDVFSASESQDLVRWHENLDASGGSWTDRPFPGTIDRPYAIVGADLDGDLDVDLAVRVLGDQELVWYANANGDGSAWTSTFVAPTPSGFANLVAADVDGDGDVDLLDSRTVADTINWYENLDGDGSAWSEWVIDTDYTVGDLAAADLDGDGDVDVVAGNRAYTNLSGDGSSWEFTLFSTSATALDVADLNLDGRPDVAFGRRDQVDWSRNVPESPLTWNEAVFQLLGLLFFPDVELADFDGDGDLDVLQGANSGFPVPFLLSIQFNTNGDGTLWEAISIPISLPWNIRGIFSADQGDIDGDGDPDILVSVTGELFGSPRQRTLWLENASGDGRTWNQRSGGGGLGNLTLMDIDGDGDLDSMCACRGLIWTENTSGDGSSWQSRTVPTSGGVSFVAAGDVDGDGDMDFLTSGSSKISWYENVSGSFDAWVERIVSRSIWDAGDVVATDVDGDGDCDVISTGSSNSLAWYENVAGDGTAWIAHTIHRGLGGGPRITLADLDEDGDLDVLSSSEDDGTVLMHEKVLADGTLWTTRGVISGPADLSDFDIGDMDGDADLDILINSSPNGLPNSWYANPSLVAPYGATNPPRSLVLQDPTPEIGEDAVFELTNPLSTQAPGSLTWVFLSLAPAPGFPESGTSAQGLGMAGPSAPGEILISLADGDLAVGPYFAGPPWPGPGSPAEIALAIPNDRTLIGLPLYAQGLIEDPSASLGVRYGLTNALRITIADVLTALPPPAARSRSARRARGPSGSSR